MIRLVSSDIGIKYWSSGLYVLTYGIAVQDIDASYAPKLFYGYFMILYVFY